MILLNNVAKKMKKTGRRMGSIVKAPSNNPNKKPSEVLMSA